MAFKEVQDLSPDNVIGLGGTNRKTNKKNAESVEGYYLGSRKVESKKAKSGFAYIHVFKTAKGNLGVWGKTDMDRKVLNVPVGTMTQVIFDRMAPTPNGEMYKFKVLVDSDNTIEVEAAPVNDSFQDEDENEDNESFESAGTETDDEDEETTRIAAERKARTQALLNRKKA